MENSQAPLQMVELPGSFLLSQQEMISGPTSDAGNEETLSGNIAVKVQVISARFKVTSNISLGVSKHKVIFMIV